MGGHSSENILHKTLYTGMPAQKNAFIPRSQSECLSSVENQLKSLLQLVGTLPQLLAALSPIWKKYPYEKD